jgi:hypothetical protein
MATPRSERVYRYGRRRGGVDGQRHVVTYANHHEVIANSKKQCERNYTYEPQWCYVVSDYRRK